MIKGQFFLYHNINAIINLKKDNYAVRILKYAIEF
jgi:hypothetical protein